MALDTDAAVALASSTPQRASERDKHLKRFFFVFFSSGKLSVLEGVVVVESHDVKIFKHLVFPSCQTYFSDGFLCNFE